MMTEQRFNRARIDSSDVREMTRLKMLRREENVHGVAITLEHDTLITEHKKTLTGTKWQQVEQ
jgi:hypothetical protein